MIAILHRTPTPRHGYHLFEMEGEFLLYCPAKMATIYLNESAATIWRLCDGQRTVAGIIDFLRGAYPSAVRQLEADVCGAIQRFASNDMLTLDSGYETGRSVA
jgi:hypothetical protein